MAKVGDAFFAEKRRLRVDGKDGFAKNRFGGGRRLDHG
jgi:hypothetical protein